LGPRSRRWRGARTCAALAISLGALGCSSSSSVPPPRAPTEPALPNAPVVAAQPGAWFDAYGNLTVVGAGRRLRLVLSAPISACSSALGSRGNAAETVAAASLPFHVLSDACRENHPAILLAEESDTASPAELEHSYHEVARCAGTDFGLLEGWVPQLIADADPCPLALGRGWRLPTTEEISGLSVDDRKNVAGALFDTEDHNAFGGLLVYARSPRSGVSLVSLSPNAAEQPPVLNDDKQARPFFGAALRCVNDNPTAKSSRGNFPVLPHAAECLRDQRQAQGRLAVGRQYQPAREVKQLKDWLDAAERVPTYARDSARLHELSTLLAAPALELIAHRARDEQALTERYAELAEGLDDPAVSQGERERRHAEFDRLRQRLGGQIVQNAEAAGSDRTTLAALLSRLQQLLESVAKAKPAKKQRGLDYEPLRAQLKTLMDATRP
jgi:hypothetical protein